MPEFRSILLWQTAFLGDAVLTLPLAQTLATAFPGAAVHLVVRKGLSPLFRSHPDLASVREFDKRGRGKGLAGARNMGREIGREGHDLLASPHASFRSALVARASGIPVRVGYSAPWYNRLAYTHTIDRRFDEFEEIERLLRLTLPLGLNETDWDHRPRLTLPQEERGKAGELLSSLPAPVLGLHPGSVWPTKRWPAGSFAAVADRALEAGASVALFAGPGEEETAAEVKRTMRGKDSPRFLDLSGELSLPLLAAVLGGLDCYLTNDSGPMHLAWTQHTPTVALFGPTVRSLGFFPRGERSVVLEADVACRPCGLHGGRTCKPGHHRCMTEITPEIAWAEVKGQLERGRG
ncbi:glycosyltransferase family 9 protein [Desulfohalovibrio reitneri]|uniref:glycosyltransferase family 9 protein n=1 Tax=Desulfohalovibrio reitneri TaxID=1307759 RepID=UPI0004A6B731|nr:glycosyltransferase family 9 protein [Desulfohalovibrio reitneri]